MFVVLSVLCIVFLQKLLCNGPHSPFAAVNTIFLGHGGKKALKENILSDSGDRLALTSKNVIPYQIYTLFNSSFTLVT